MYPCLIGHNTAIDVVSPLAACDITAVLCFYIQEPEFQISSLLGFHPMLFRRRLQSQHNAEISLQPGGQPKEPIQIYPFHTTFNRSVARFSLEPSMLREFDPGLHAVDSHGHGHRLMAYVHTNDKRLAQLNLMRDILSRPHYAAKNKKLVQPDPSIAFEFTPDCLKSERLAH